MPALLILLTGCATIRVTDPPRTASEQFLESQACSAAVEQLSAASLRDRRVYVDSTFLIGAQSSTTRPTETRILLAELRPTAEQLFLLGELRSKLLNSGVRLADQPDQADIILEVRTGGIGVDRADTLLGIPSVYLSPGGSGVNGNVPLLTPEIAIYKHISQHGFGSVAFVAYWRRTGEVVASSGPYVGRTVREDYFLFGTGPRTVGNIPTAQGPSANQ